MLAAVGPTGPAGDSAIIPFASGATPMSLTSILGGLAGTPAFVSFGTSTPGVTALGLTIDLSGIANHAFVVPRDGIITSFSAFFSTTAALTLVGTTVTIHARLYQNTTLDNNFSAITATDIALSPALNGIVAIGAASSGSLTGLSIPVTAGTRLMLVYYITATGVTLINTVAGTGSAGVAIS